jgi:hypothetical protein
MCTGRQIVALTASIFLGWVSITLYYVNFTEAPAFILERLLKDCVGIRGFRSCSYVLSFFLFFLVALSPLCYQQTTNKNKVELKRYTTILVTTLHMEILKV